MTEWEKTDAKAYAEVRDMHRKKINLFLILHEQNEKNI